MFNKALLYSAIATYGVVGSSANAQKRADHPNVILFVVDDWGANDMSFAGSKFYETPNVDALASTSNMFNNGYVCYPRSVPSRYSLITGRHCARPQEGSKNDERHVDESSYSIAEPFKEAGYETFIIGKWHLSTKTSSPESKGFDINIGAGHAGAPASYFNPFNIVKRNGHQAKDPILGMDDAEPGEYLTDYMGRKTVDYIKQKHDKPFFAYCSFYAVHTPLEAKEEPTKRFKDKRNDLGLTQDTFIPEEAGVRKGEQNNAVYAAMIESVDQAIGSIIDALKESGQYENSIIVLISDHGGLSNRGTTNRELATTNAPLKAGKGHLYEGGIRVPYLIHLPNQKKQKKHSELAMSFDIFPTLADLCNVPLKADADIDGVSLGKLINSGKQSELKDRALFWHKAAERPNSTGDYVSSAMRKGKYKLIDFYHQDRLELYDLESDPSESNNLADQLPQITSQMHSELNEWKRSNNVIVKAKGATAHKGNKSK